MVQGTIEGTIGISIRDTTLRMTETSSSNGEYQVVRLSQGRVRTPFQLSSVKNSELVRKFAEDINRLYETADFETKRAVFTLDSNMVLIKKIPVDVNLSDQRLRNHINWEIEQCVINPIKDYVIDFEYLQSKKTNADFAEVIVVIVRRSVVNFIKEIFNITELKLSAIDVDVFAAQRIFCRNGGTQNNKYIALIDVRKGNFQFSIIKNSEFVLIQDIDDPREETVSYDSEYIAKILSKELKKIMLDSRSEYDIDTIYIYGDDITDGIVDALKNKYDTKIYRANPFRNIKTIDQLVDPVVLANPETFVVSVGAALK